MAMIGYARVSTSDQNPDAQASRLREHGCGWHLPREPRGNRLALRRQTSWAC